MYIRLLENYPIRKDCIVVRGDKSPALYDFKSRKVFAINYTAGDIIDLCDGGKNILDIANILSKRYEMVNIDEMINYILDLKEKGLINLLSNGSNEQIEKKNMLEVSLKDYDKCLKMIHCEITSKCNLKCVHCYGKFGNTFIQDDELSIDEWKRVISDAKKLESKTFQFIGGEPILRKDFLELFRYTYLLGFEWIDIFTNATLVSENIARELAKKGVEIRFSVYGHIPEIHDEITQVKGSFKLLIDGIKKLKKYDNHLKAEAILNVKNINYKEEMDNFFKNEFDIPVHFGITRPSHVKDFELVPGVITEQYCKFPDSFGRKKEGDIYSETNDFSIRKKWNECFAGRLCISAKGDVMPCIFARELLIGNIKDKSLIDMYREDARFFRDSYKIDNVNECKNCELRYACRDCRPWAYSITGNWYAKNPYCHYKPNGGDSYEARREEEMGEA